VPPRLPSLSSGRRAARILDFDIENRPLSYWYDGQATAEITAIAWSWMDEQYIYLRQLQPLSPRWSAERMLQAFKTAYDAADMVTGHYIRRHDLPIINAALLELQLPLLSEKLTSDTKLDLVGRADLSMSQESLEAMYGLPVQKFDMRQQDWRDANRRTPAGMKMEAQRVTSDVRGHKLLRARLIEAGALKRPKMWRP